MNLLFGVEPQSVSDIDFLRMRDFTFTYSFEIPSNSSIKGLDLY